ncbi:PIN domain-containing protein [Azohydromonas australica]|uniref:PIN domain-containing protein n=1 Tax=Azohydromonas australica TaxID=364039 RepID=UPI00048E2979|nr:twitching motility protein PilT [Azohydromonas australica]
MRVVLDTSLLAYTEGQGDESRCGMALRLVEQLPGTQVVLPAQALDEPLRVLAAKARRPAAEVREALLGWADSSEVADSTQQAFQAALDLTVDHQLPMWDALTLFVVAESRCWLLLSEDLSNGFTWRGVTVVNPFAPQRAELLGLLQPGA